MHSYLCCTEAMKKSTMDCTFHISLQLSQFLHWHNSPYSLLLWSHNIHMNFTVIKHMVTSVTDKHFGLVDTGQIWLDGKKTPSSASMVLLSLGPIAASVFFYKLKVYLMLLLLHGILHLTQIWKSDIYSVAYIMCILYLYTVVGEFFFF